MVSTTTIRLDPAMKKTVERRAKSLGLSFSEVSRLLFAAFGKGDIAIGAVQYPESYASMIQKERGEMQTERKMGKAKLYSSTKKHVTRKTAKNAMRMVG